jgi:hypothetical protein
MPSPSEAPSGGAKPFAYFLAFEKVSRRKGETISRRYRSNGYAPKKWPGQPHNHCKSNNNRGQTLKAEPPIEHR